MKIALLAPSGAGKTTFLTGLYGVLTRDINEDSEYGINFAVTDSKARGYLEDRYTALVEENDFGEPSAQLDKYPFTLTAYDRGSNTPKKLEIQLIDFPGGHLYRVGDGEDAKKDVDNTIEELSTCDGFIVLLDGHFVVQGAEQNNYRVTQNRLRADAVKQVLYKALEKRRQYIAQNTGRTNPSSYAFNSGKTPIVFALTKGDIVENWVGQSIGISTLSALVTSLFKNTSHHSPQEGVIANLIRSQYQQIFDMQDVVTLRTAITVYDETKKSFAPKHLEKLLQFALLAGLDNAVNEYERRFKEWDKYDTEQLNFANQRAYELSAAERERKNYQQDDLLTRIFKTLDGRGLSHHDTRVKNASSLYSVASSARSSAFNTREQARVNRDNAQFFRERILSPAFAYALSKGPGKQSFFYQNGLPLEKFEQESWWKTLCTKETEQPLPSPK